MAIARELLELTVVARENNFELNKVESYRSKQAARQQKIQRDNEKAQRQRQSSARNNDNQTEEPIA
jgi:hypothetical protein